MPPKYRTKSRSGFTFIFMPDVNGDIDAKVYCFVEIAQDRFLAYYFH